MAVAAPAESHLRWHLATAWHRPNPLFTATDPIGNSPSLPLRLFSAIFQRQLRKACGRSRREDLHISHPAATRNRATFCQPVPLPTLNKLLPVVYSQRRSLNVATSVSSSSFLLVGLSLWTSLEKQATFFVSLLQFSYVIIFSQLPHKKLLSR